MCILLIHSTPLGLWDSGHPRCKNEIGQAVQIPFLQVFCRGGHSIPQTWWNRAAADDMFHNVSPEIKM